MMWRRKDEASDDNLVGAPDDDPDFDLSAFDPPNPAADTLFSGPLGWIGIPDAEPILGDAVEVRVSVDPGEWGRRVVSVETRYTGDDTRREALLAAVLVLVEDLRGRPL